MEDMTRWPAILVRAGCISDTERRIVIGAAGMVRRGKPLSAKQVAILQRLRDRFMAHHADDLIEE